MGLFINIGWVEQNGCATARQEGHRSHLQTGGAGSSLARSGPSGSPQCIDESRARHLECPTLTPCWRRLPAPPESCSTFSVSIVGGLVAPDRAACCRQSSVDPLRDQHSLVFGERAKQVEQETHRANSSCVDRASVKERKATPRIFRSSTILIRWESDRPRRSSFQTTSTSPLAQSAAQAFSPGRSSRAPEARS